MMRARRVALDGDPGPLWQRGETIKRLCGCGRVFPAGTMRPRRRVRDQFCPNCRVKMARLAA